MKSPQIASLKTKRAGFIKLRYSHPDVAGFSALPWVPLSPTVFLKDMRPIYLHFIVVLPATEICGLDEVEILLPPSHRIKEAVTEDFLEAHGQLA